MSREKAIIDQAVACYHCGESCEEELIRFDDKAFCCSGCKLVFELLDENDLCNYYDLENSPGISLKHRGFQEKFTFLANKEIQEKLLNYSSTDLNKIILKVPAIHCSSCIWLLEHLDVLRDGIISSRVNFVRKEVSIDFNPQVISLKTVVELLTTLGYEPEINLQSSSGVKTKSVNRKLYLQIGIAGFCFGNIMLLSFPEYLGFDGFDQDIQRFIGWANIALSLPVVFFSASTYYSSAVKGLNHRFVNIDVPISLGISTLFIRSLFDIITSSGPGYMDSLSGLVFFLLIGKWFQSKTYDSLSFERDYKSYFPLAVTRIIDSSKEVVQVLELRAGDLIEVRNREVIPADAILMSDSAAIDYSFVTGEANIIQKNKDSRIYAGGRQVGNAIKLKVIKEVSQSYLTQLWNRDSFQKDSTYNSFIDRISKYFTFTVLLIALATATYWFFNNPANILNSVTAVLIVACPCALALATPFTLGNVMAILGRNKLYLKHMNVIEQLWYITTFVFDKTGTLTKGSSDSIHFHGKLSQEEKNLVVATTIGSTHPLSRMITAKTYTTKNLSASTFNEIAGKGLESFVMGHRLVLGSKQFVTDSNSDNEESTMVYLTIDDELKGYYTFGNEYRQQLGETINALKHNKLVVLSGDNESQVKKLSTIFPHNAEFIFRQKPEDKLAFISSKQQAGEKVVMFGDGLNDAGALKQADVGIAVAEDVSAFTPASDAILYGGNFHQVGKFLNFAKSSRQIIIAGFSISFLYNIIGLSFAVSANLTPLFAAILMPLSSITVVAFATFAVRGLAFKHGL